MGLIRMGPPARLVQQLKEEFGIDTFVETGTFCGQTALWAASEFQKVITVELSEPIYKKVAAENQNNTRIEFMFGDSRIKLKEIVSRLTKPAIFWLDSHWSGGETYGKNDECPLLEELKIICGSPIQHFLLIDDARLFCSPPPLPHGIDEWPCLEDVFNTIQREKHRYYTVLIEDVIIAVAMEARTIVASYCQEVNTRAWSERNQALAKSKPGTVHEIAVRLKTNLVKLLSRK